jgi:hypothetical protein
MARKLLFATMAAWLILFGARAGAQQTAPATAQETAPATAQQPTSETPTQPVEQQPIVPATSNPTPPGSLQAAPDQAGTILPGFGFPYGSGPNLTGTGITPFSLGGLVTGTGILPYQQAVGPSPTLFQVNQNVRFNDNVQFVPQGGKTPLGLQKGDWSETTVATVSPSMYISEQILFAHATYGFNRYRQDVGLDSNFWNADAGLTWKFRRLCTGTGQAAISQNLVPFQELTAFALQTVTTQSVIETANCKLTDRVSGIIEGSYRTSEISGGNNQSVGNAGSANNYKEQQIRAGLEYVLPGLDTVRPQATFTAREFGNRPAGITTITGLASRTDLELYELVYHRDLSPKLKFDGNLGFNQITTTSPTTISPGSSSTNSTGWSYSAALLYSATPKLTFQATSAQGVGPPLAVLSNFQATRFQTLSLYYRYSAKLTFTAAFSQGTTLNATSNLSFSGTGSSGTGVNPVAGVIQTRSVLIGAQYRASPFLNAFATYSYLDSKNAQLGTTTLQNVYLVGLTWQH